MKTTTIITGLFFSLSTAAKVPLTLELTSNTNSNIDKVSNPVKKDVFSQKVGLKSKLKFRPMKKVILIDLPSVNLEYTPSLTEKVRSLAISNTLIALYLPKRGLIYSGSFTTGYSKSIFTNEDQEIENSKNWSVGADGGFGYDFNKTYNLGLNVGAKVQNYFEAANPTEALPLKDDNLKLSAKLTNKFKLKKGHTVAINASYANKVYKEKRALNSSGDAVSTSAETINTTKVNTYYALKLKHVLFNPDIGYTINKDTVADGRTYKGPEFKLKFTYFFGYLNLLSKFSYKKRDYKTQLVDTTDTTGISPILKAKVKNISYTIEVPFGQKKKNKVLLGHEYQALNSNRKSDDNINEIYKIGIVINF